MDRTNNVLQVDNIESYYGPIMAIRGVSLRVQEGQLVTVLGANGAGKTTLLKTISGVMDPEKGTIQLNGEEVTGVHEALDLTRFRSPLLKPMLAVRVPRRRHWTFADS